MVIESSVEDREKVRNKKVLLYSQGMDSVMYAHLLHPDILLNIDCNIGYEKEEAKRLYSVAKKIGLEDRVKVVEDFFDFSSIERKDYIVPNRNAYLILKASEYGETVYLSSVEGDRSTDKDEEFYKIMKGLLDHIWLPQHWSEQRIFDISAPFKHMTKTELLKLYLEKNGSVEAIEESYSCYQGEKIPCGICKPCGRKWVAMENNNLNTTNYFQNEPWKAPWIDEILPKILKHEYRGREDSDMIQALKKVGRIK